MVASTQARVGSLLAGIAICAALPGLAHSEPALYTGSIDLRLWETDIPYGALLNGPGMANSPPGDWASLAGSSPAAFTLPYGQIALTTSVVDSSPTPASLDYRRTMFSGANDAGSFFEGGAPPSKAFVPLPSIPGGQFGASFSGPPDRFGGVMKLLGRFDWRGERASCTYCPYHTVIPLSPIGGSFGETATATTWLGGTAAPPTFVTATVWGFPWDTGAVQGVAAVAGTASPTATYAVGTDQRTASGLGTLQLVTPFLVRVKSHPPFCGGCENRWFYSGIARAEIHFVPEPAPIAVLATGLAALAVLFQRSKRRAAR